MAGRDEFKPVAFDTYFDPNNDPDCNLTQETVQEAIEELCNNTSASASPGFTWGKSGAVSNSWLLNDSVPSNLAGRNFSLNSGLLTQVAVSNENINTFDVEIYEHDGTTFTLLATVSIVAARSGVFDDTDFGTVNITQGKELATKIVNGSSKNPVVACILSGTIT